MIRIFALVALAGGLSLNAALFPKEPLGQSSRLTSIIISEIMFNPLERTDGKRLEFIELFNTLSTPEDLSGYRLDGDVHFVFPAGTVIPARSFLVVARVPADLESVYGLSGVLGPFAEGAGLPNNGGMVQLRHRTGAVFLEVNYSARHPWPASADGGGHSLVLARPSYGEGDSRAWSASHSIGGSPGLAEPSTTDPAESIFINEFLAHTDDPEVDFIELYNHSNSAVDLSGCVLTDNPLTNKFVLPPGSRIPARGFLSFSQTELNFSLSADGEAIYFKNAASTRILDSIRFEGQENGVSMGRYPDGAADFYRLQSKTPGASNGPVRVAEVVINEIMYHPISEDDDEQFVELFNRGAVPVDLSGWRLEDGISFTIPANTTVEPGGYLVVGRDAARLRTNYPGLTRVVGNFDGRLAYSGERIALSRPDFGLTTNNVGAVLTNVFYIPVEEVTYGDGGRWGQWSDGGGSSLERVDARADSRRASNWADSDETAKAGWTVASRTGRIDNGNVAADQLQVLLQGAGEALIDEVEVLDESGVNRVENSAFDSGTTGWTAEGTQDRSVLNVVEGYSTSPSYQVRAVERGDNQINRIRTGLISALAEGSTATIKAKVRWLKGHPEVLFRLRGNWLDMSVVMEIPKNLGTPGAPNTRAATNGPPTIYEVMHTPVLPAAGQAVLVTARVSDPDGLSAFSLRYRIDPSAALSTVPLLDNGTGGDEIAGDGIFSGRIPGQGSGVLVAYHVAARDALNLSSTYPGSAGVNELLVRFGETTPTGTFPIYRIWMTQATFNTWSNRPKLNNTPLPVTFVVGNHRVIQNSSGLYAGSPYISGGYDTPSGNRCGYTLAFPSDERFLGDSDLVLDWPGGHGNERTAMQEQMAYWMTDQIDLPYSHRYWIRLQVNGVTDMQRGTVFEAVNQPAGDFLDAWIPEIEEVDFYKIDRAFEFSDSGSLIADPQPRLENYTTVGGAKKTEKYRWTFMKRSYESANNYDNIFSLVDALNAPNPEPYTSQTETLVNLEEWMGILAMEHIIVNFDAYGHQIGKNMYTAKPEGGKWELYMFDLDWLMLAATGFSSDYGPSSAPLFNAEDPTMVRMYNHPPFRRAYFRNVKKAVDGPMRPEVCNAVMDQKYAALVANGITMCDGQTLTQPTAVKNWFSQRRTFLVNQLDTIAAGFAITTPRGSGFNPSVGVAAITGLPDFSTNAAVVTLTGTAPIEVETIMVNGAAYTVTWTSVNQWSMRLALQPGLNTFNLQALDAEGLLIPGLTDSIAIASTSPSQSAAGHIVINEIMANPPEVDAEFVEILNTSTNLIFDLSGWRLNGVDFDFPNGTLLNPGAFLVIAKDAGAFTRAYGNTVTLAGQFSGRLDHEGETLSLLDQEGSVIDVVTYADVAPWPATVPGTSLQLIDPLRDNYRVANWATSAPTDGTTNEVQWQFVSTKGTASTSRLYVYMTSPGEVYIDDLMIVPGFTADAGVNQVENADFETAFPGPWVVSANLSASAVSSTVKHSGTRSLRIVSSAAGTTQGSSIWQDIGPLVINDPYTLSYWYLPSTNGAGLTVRLSGNGISHTQNISPSENSSIQATPGLPNSVRQSLPEFPAVWINEIQPRNATGPTDNLGEHDPWLELYNRGDSTVTLDGWYLASNSSNLTQWAFPAGTTIAPRQFLIVWMDGEAVESGGGILHAGFRIPETNGFVALVSPVNSQPQLLDYVTYSSIAADRSLGFFPDGQPGPRKTLFFSTPGAPNNDGAQPLPIFINEWMAANTSSIPDPADGDFDDWFELYNPNPVAIDLSGYDLSDSLTNINARWRIPVGTAIPANGFILVWADDETGQNVPGSGDLHAAFRLSQGGEAIALFAPNGALIDSVVFGPQTNNISQGRSPDGSATIQFLPEPSPGMLNSPAPPSEIILAQPVLEGATIIVQWTSEPGRQYRLLRKTDLNALEWTVAAEVTATSTSTAVSLPATLANQFFRVERD